MVTSNSKLNLVTADYPCLQIKDKEPAAASPIAMPLTPKPPTIALTALLGAQRV